ncbi:hypothetical protein OIV83_001434 [Microbotryomycetes sp. JL201]|nr:hypothetical protein OIV83_001434 [Microbotryomycetes sp. JL201]
MLRLGSPVARLAAAIIAAVVLLHFIASSTSPDDYDYSFDEGDGDDDGRGVINWSEKLGLDHYKDWEHGVTNKLGGGLDRVVGGLGVIKGGLGWGAKGTKLGSLYELVAASSSSSAYYDKRTSLDKLKLSSTRVLGHGEAEEEALRSPDEDEDEVASRPRRHILVTGGFGSIGKHVVRDLLLGPAVASGSAWSSKSSDDQFDDDAREEDILITILDVRDRTPELNFLLQSAPYKGPRIKGTDPRTQAFSAQERSVDSFRRSGKLRTIVGDVRDKELLETILAPTGTTITQTGTQQAAALLNAKLGRVGQGSQHLTTTVVVPPVSGIIHLAAYSPSLCRQNPTDCENVERKGMSVLLDHLENFGDRVSQTEVKTGARRPQQVVQGERPWLIVPRRADMWEEMPGVVNWNASSLSTVAAEESLKAFARNFPLHSMLLQLPSAYSIIGDPYAPRFDPVPHMVQSALGHLPIEVSAFSDEQEPFIAVDDASRAVVQGARMLELAGKKDYLKALGFVSEVEVIGPPLVQKALSPLYYIAKTVIKLTTSQSPLATFETEREPLIGPQPSPANDRKRAARVLGFAPALSIRTALRRYLTMLLKLQATHLATRVNVACSSPPSIPVLEEGLLALSGCNAQLLTVIEGAYYTLGCSQGIEDQHTEPLSVLPAVPFKEGVRGVEILAERGLEGKVDLQLRCHKLNDKGELSGESEVVVWATASETGAAPSFTDQSKAGEHIVAEWYSVDFIHRDSRSFTLSLPPTEGVAEGEEPKRRLVLQNSAGKIVSFQTIAGETRPMLWRINPICCAATDRRKDVWDFFKEDPLLTSQVEYPSEDGRTTLSDSTLSLKRCQDLRAEHDEISRLQKALSSVESAVCKPKQSTAATWTKKDSPICHVDCTAPLICVASKTCKCTRDRCGDKSTKGPFPDVRYSEQLSFGTDASAVKEQTLAERVEAVPLESLILPGAKRAFSTALEDMPRPHVVELPESIDTHTKNPACTDIDQSPLPFLGDHFMVEAMRNRSVSLEEADFVVVPYYQGCYYNYLQENTFKKLADTMGFAEQRVASAPPHITGTKIVIPFTHDFGSCTGWWPKLEDVLGRSPPSPMDQAIAWQVNGDYNTRCVKPDRDIIVPAVSKHSKSLFDSFKSLDNVLAVSKRQHLGFFAGGVRGFGAIVRTKIGCGRAGGETDEGVKASRILYQKYAPGERYLGTLNASKFCLLPRGIPAWTTRTYEAIYAGCIPAFIVDRNLLPFQDVLDYSKFSVTIPESEAHQVEDILARYTDSQMTELQTNLLKVRDAFVFGVDKGSGKAEDVTASEWDRKGDLLSALSG